MGSEVEQKTCQMHRGLPDHLMYKNDLQEYTQKLGLPFPIYQTIDEGCQHAPRFKSKVLVDGATYESKLTHPRKKEAEQDAAKSALECIREKIKSEGCPVVREEPKHWKSILYEYAVRKRTKNPEFTTKQEGPQPTYISMLLFDGKTFTSDQATGSKKDAEQQAARIAIKTLLDSDSGILRQIIESKVNKGKASLSSFNESNIAVLRKTVESSHCRHHHHHHQQQQQQQQQQRVNVKAEPAATTDSSFKRPGGYMKREIEEVTEGDNLRRLRSRWL